MLAPRPVRLPLAPVTPLVAVAALLATLSGCVSPSGGRPLSERERQALADSVREIVQDAYDLSKGDVPRRMLSIYPESGRVVSATAGRVTTTRDLLATSVHAFWEGVGQYMIRPTWTWSSLDVDVLDRNTAIMTAQYTVPHWTDEGRPHVIGGVWTALWRRRDGRWRVTNEHLSDMPRPAAEAIEATMPTIAPTVLPDSVPARSH